MKQPQNNTQIALGNAPISGIALVKDLSFAIDPAYVSQRATRCEERDALALGRPVQQLYEVAISDVPAAVHCLYDSIKVARVTDSFNSSGSKHVPISRSATEQCVRLRRTCGARSFNSCKWAEAMPEEQCVPVRVILDHYVNEPAVIHTMEIDGSNLSVQLNRKEIPILIHGRIHFRRHPFHLVDRLYHRAEIEGHTGRLGGSFHG